MKKVLLFAALTLLPLLSNAQRIEHDDVDNRNRRSMYTNWENINWASKGYQLQVRMELQGNVQSIRINWICDRVVGVDKGSKVVLFYDDFSMSSLVNESFAMVSAGNFQNQEIPAGTKGMSINSLGNFSALLGKKLRTLRINTTEGFADFPISDADRSKFVSMYNVFEERVKDASKIKKKKY